MVMDPWLDPWLKCEAEAPQIDFHILAPPPISQVTFLICSRHYNFSTFLNTSSHFRADISLLSGFYLLCPSVEPWGRLPMRLPERTSSMTSLPNLSSSVPASFPLNCGLLKGWWGLGGVVLICLWIHTSYHRAWAVHSECLTFCEWMNKSKHKKDFQIFLWRFIVWKHFYMSMLNFLLSSTLKNTKCCINMYQMNNEQII